MTDTQESMGTTSGLVLEENIKYKLQDGEMAKEKDREHRSDCQKSW